MDIAALRQIGPYKIIRFIDAGAFAWVFEVVDPKFEGRRLALKMLKPEAAAGEEFRRFEAEARLLAQIDHPAVVTIFDFGRDDQTGNFYYAMTYVDGPTLKEKLKEGQIKIEVALPIFFDLLDGLARLHEESIIHRDIKPGNVLLGRDGRARLADLGIARVQTEVGQTRTGVAVGTALYMSPEQARGRPVDPRSDLFSLALTFYEAITGDVIYDHVDSIDSSSGMDVLMYIGSLVHTQTEFDIRFSSDSTVPGPIQKFILKATRLDPTQRYQSAVEMRDALREAVRQTHEQPVARSGVSPKLLAGVGAAAAGVLAVVSFYFFYWSPQQQLAALQNDANAALERALARNEAAIAIVSDVKDLSPGPEEALLEQVDDRLQRADAYLEDSGTDIAAGSYELALKNLERSRAQHVAACQSLVEAYLAGRAQSDGTAFEERTLSLGDRGAPEVVPESWGPLVQKLTGLRAIETAGTGCDLARAELDRIELAGAGMPLADSVDAELVRVWPELVEEAHQKAVTARMVAVAVPADAREYKLALKDAKRFLVQGGRSLRKEDYLAARSSYRSAREGFIVASQIAPAALARAEARGVAESAKGEDGVEDLGGAGDLLARGEAAYAAGQWQPSEELYKQALARVKELRAANEWRRAAIKAQKEAQVEREAAIAAGAKSSAPIEFDQADVWLSDATRALDSGDAKAAELGFAEARDAYGAAHKHTIQSLRDADMKRAAVVSSAERLVGEGGCAGLLSGDARAQCEQGNKALAQGSEALGALDAPAALRNFVAATESYARASSAQVLWETARPRPPELVRRVPQRAVVRISPRQLHGFAIEANDPNGDLLHYTWTINDQVQEERGPTLKRRLEADSVVGVKVDDGKGGELIEQWQVEVVERTQESL
jgi:serine/threonine protein kinase